MNIPSFRSYGEYASSNYGVNCMMFTDAKGDQYYFSYKTLVAFNTSKTGLVCIKNYWRQTTGKHLNWIEDDHSRRVDREQFDKLLASI